VAYVADRSTNRIRGILPNATVFTLGGNGSSTPFADGGATSSTFFNPIGIAASPFQQVYVADFANNRLRAISTATLQTTTLSVTGASASVDGPAGSAASKATTGVAMSVNASQLFFTDNVNSAALLRVVHLASGRVATLGRGLTLINGGGACSGGIAQLRNLSVLVADTGNHRLALLLGNGSFVTFAGRLGVAGHGDGPRDNVTFSFPTDVMLDSDGTLLVVDAGNNALRRVRQDGSAVTLAGGNPAGFVDLAFGGAAVFNSPCSVAGRDGVYLVSDTGNHRIRRVQCSERVTYNVSTLVGGGASGRTTGSTDGTGTSALLSDPAAIALSASNEDAARVVDMSNSRLRRVGAKCRGVTTRAGGPRQR
jgi:DNA-binding beta-propeller fold protein YncE